MTRSVAISAMVEPICAGKKVVLTYGTFDLFHKGHLNLLERLRRMGDKLIVGVSTDEFNASKGKKTVIPFADRSRLIASLRCVDEVIPESSWEQKHGDIERYGVAVFGIGADWSGKFDDLKDLCDVVYLPRTEGVSTTELKDALRVLSQTHIVELKHALDTMSSIIARLE